VTQTVNPSIEWQTSKLSGKVLKMAMLLEARPNEPYNWQANYKTHKEEGKRYRKIGYCNYIITPALNALLNRGG